MSHQGSIDDFTSFFIAYRPRLVSVIARFFRGSRDEIEDILQDVWIKGSQAWPPRIAAHARAWLGRIAINEAINRSRRAKRSPFVAANDDTRSLDHPDPGPSPDELAMRRQSQRLVERAIGKLEERSPRQVAVMRLVHLEERTYLEAAALLDIAEGTAKSQAFKAVENLRIALTAEKAA
ncbi:MAG TPA: sigma-70 family RNA polymerase sigma factor [Candidatus Baltobacteraceae bacterium]|jgi:RNA polymerase sigma-70 factor (ECF subfamily)|nr:sigma-70 family RNA polymerase sigma factor [Candidatus Baltobacteraceae bacterium]